MTSLTFQYHNNGDPGFARNGRDLNRFRCEFSTYQNLSSFGVCEKGVVPHYYRYINQLDTNQFRPHLDHFIHDLYHPKAMIFEYLPNAESLNCVNYSKEHFQKAIDGIQEIHKALVHHQDVYPKNILLVPGDPERMLWIDFDVATTFSSHKAMSQKEDYSLLEYEIVKDFGELLVRIPLTLLLS